MLNPSLVHLPPSTHHYPVCNEKLKTDEIKQKYRERETEEKKIEPSSEDLHQSESTNNNTADDANIHTQKQCIIAIITAIAIAAVAKAAAAAAAATGEQRHRGQWVRMAKKMLSYFSRIIFVCFISFYAFLYTTGDMETDDFMQQGPFICVRMHFYLSAKSNHRKERNARFVRCRRTESDLYLRSMLAH